MALHKVWEIIPKKVRQINGESLSPAMRVVVTTKNYVGNPFNNGAEEIFETYKRIYNFDYKKCGCMPIDFDFRPLD
ncbi:MAG: hypothetical protein J1F38_06220 [Muribaculaceae bacterium]|nr:hypothetical protein [Muribaculaceae bacterium]